MITCLVAAETTLAFIIPYAVNVLNIGVPQGYRGKLGTSRVSHLIIGETGTNVFVTSSRYTISKDTQYIMMDIKNIRWGRVILSQSIGDMEL
mgnify:CR=1 FL=1